MFQYSAGRAMAIRNNTVLKLDLSYYQNNPVRRYSLNVFKIDEKIATSREINKFKPPFLNGKSNYFRIVFAKYFPCIFHNFIIEQSFDFDKSIVDYKNENAYLEGYWQSESYFLDLKDIIKKDFTWKIDCYGINKHFEDRISESNSVSVHFRRGDYITNRKTNQILGVQPLTYYSNAMACMAKIVKEPLFFVFSDDIKWVRSNLNTRFDIIFVDHNSQNGAHNDLQLMSLCKHHIIANSSFSWWAAWLSDNPSKSVIAPIKWFAKQEGSLKSLHPKEWKVI